MLQIRILAGYGMQRIPKLVKTLHDKIEDQDI